MNCLFLPLLDYGDLVWGDRNNITLMNHLQILQNKVAKCILDMPSYASSTEALHSLKWCPLSTRRRFGCCYFVFKALNNEVDFAFEAKAARDIHSYDTRRKSLLRLPACKTNWGQQRSQYAFIADWNSLLPIVTESNSYLDFKNRYFKPCKYCLILSFLYFYACIYFVFYISLS